MHDSDRAAQIQASPELRRRLEAIMRTVWWNDDAADPRAPIPLDDLAWACASNPTIAAAVEAREQLDGGNNAVPLGIYDVSDNDLKYIVVTVAWPRLQRAPLAGP